MLLYILVLFLLLRASIGLFRKNLLDRALEKSNLELQTRQALSATLYYFSIIVGTIIILNTAGLDLSILTVTAGALGVGLSLGLQTVAKNFIGGLVIISEKPIRYGDHIQVGDTAGTVTKISLRATTVRTKDNTDVIIPNADFMSGKVVNWSLSTKDVIVPVNLFVSADAPVEKVERIILKCAEANALVEKSPPPELWLDRFDAKGLAYILRVSTCDYDAAQGSLRSGLNRAILEELRKNEIRSGEG